VNEIIVVQTLEDESRYEKAGFKFTPRENEIIYWLLRGKLIHEVSELVNLAADTVYTHRAHIFEKTKTQSEAQLILLAIKKRIFTGAEILKWK
jgi:DNA-binding CsgD family transcriptional regulator